MNVDRRQILMVWRRYRFMRSRTQPPYSVQGSLRLVRGEKRVLLRIWLHTRGHVGRLGSLERWGPARCRVHGSLRLVRGEKRVLLRIWLRSRGHVGRLGSQERWGPARGRVLGSR